MPSRGGPVHVVTTSRAYKGRVYKSHLLRRSYREGGQVKNETVGNLSHLPEHVVDLVRRSLRGECFASPESLFEVIESPKHGHVQAVRLAMKHLGFEELLSSLPCRERDLCVAMVASRILAPQSKLASTRYWTTTTLATDLGVSDANEDELYAAMDWLLARQERIEKKLAARHLDENSLVLYDLTSSYFEGTKCPLAALGHDRDGKKGKLQVNYGLLTNGRGCPVSVSVFSGNTSDTKTLLPQVRKVKETFGIKILAVVGDRGMIGQKQIDQLRAEKDVSWITALKSRQIEKLLEQRSIQLGLFDERNLFEIVHPDYPGERLVACRNPELARLRAHKRQSLIEATTRELDKVKRTAERKKIRGKGEIGVRIGRVINKYKVAKHFALDIGEEGFIYSLREDRIAAEAALDGIYVIRTGGLDKERLTADDAVRGYKSLANVERAFRCLKTIDLKVRPIFHHLEDRVRAHIFLCMLAYYVEWHMQEAWRELTFSDEDQEAKKTRDPVAPAKRSEKALDKVQTHQLEDGTQVHSFRTLLEDLSGIVRNICRPKGALNTDPTFRITTTPSVKQRRAFELLETIAV